MSDPRLELLLALGDDELVIGHRHSSWTGVAPHLEEDLAFSSIAQDEIGHAVVWYRLAAELAGEEGVTAGGDLGVKALAQRAPAGGDLGVKALAQRAPAGGDLVDGLGLGRQPDGYRNAVLVERPNGDWGYTLARHYCYDIADDVRLSVLGRSSWEPLAEATHALRREERYHLAHARTWLDRLARGPVAARSHLTDGLVAALAEAPGLFEPVLGEPELVACGVLPVDSAGQHDRWLETVTADLQALDLDHLLAGGGHHAGGEFVATSSGELLSDDEAAEVPRGDGGLGGRRGRHSPDFTEVWEEMTGMYRAYPGVRW